MNKRLVYCTYGVLVLVHVLLYVLGLTSLGYLTAGITTIAACSLTLVIA